MHFHQINKIFHIFLKSLPSAENISLWSAISVSELFLPWNCIKMAKMLLPLCANFAEERVEIAATKRRPLRRKSRARTNQDHTPSRCESKQKKTFVKRMRSAKINFANKSAYKTHAHKHMWMRRHEHASFNTLCRLNAAGGIKREING